jgi:mycothiol system anti-sigma-R factor
MISHNCDDALTSLYQYLDQELEAANAKRIREHLEECGMCLSRFDFEARLKTVVRDRLAEDVPEEFISKLKQAIADDPVTDC